ncbi:MAG: hypothetical protein AAB691_01440 [Patescibacteria group bacterium]
MNTFFLSFDRGFLGFFRKIHLPLVRFAIFLPYFWFGFLKVLGTSPANLLVNELLQKTLPFITFDQFIVSLGWYEMLIGLIFLFPGLERWAFTLLAPHLVMIAAPLMLLPAVTWQAFLVPTIEGQYIIKNIMTVALAASLAASILPLEAKSE